MYKSVIPSLLLFSVMAASAAQADSQYNDPKGRFSVSVPDGWVTVMPDKANIGLVMGKPAGSDVPGACLVMITPTPQTESKTQTEVDDAVRTELTTQFWIATYNRLGSQDVVIADQGSRTQDARNVQYVVVEFTTKTPDGKTARMKGHEEVHALPGVIHDVGCTTYAEKYDLASAEFTKILSSYTPQSGLVAQAPSPPSSVMTLYANASFDGTARVLSTDTPSVAALGWPAQTGSLAVSGFGEWQVCEGINYTGKCNTMVGAHAGPANGFLRVGSLRPLSSQSSLRGAASVVSSDTARLVDEAVRQLTRH